MSEAKVKVKILKYVGHYEPGQIVEVSPEEAAQLCAKSQVHLGGLNDHVRAITLDEMKSLEEVKVDASKMTAAEFAALGLKNIVHTPKDVAFEAKLAAIKKADEEAKLEAELKLEAEENKKSKKKAKESKGE